MLGRHSSRKCCCFDRELMEERIACASFGDCLSLVFTNWWIQVTPWFRSFSSGCSESQYWDTNSPLLAASWSNLVKWSNARMSDSTFLVVIGMTLWSTTICRTRVADARRICFAITIGLNIRNCCVDLVAIWFGSLWASWPTSECREALSDSTIISEYL